MQLQTVGCSAQLKDDVTNDTVKTSANFHGCELDEEGPGTQSVPPCDLESLSVAALRCRVKFMAPSTLELFSPQMN